MVNLSAPKSKKQKSLFKALLISLLSGAALIILFVSILFILFLVYKDDISKSFLLSVNQKINGEVKFSEISFTPFKHFPNGSLKLYDLTLQESKDSVLNVNNPPVFDIDEAYISINILDLISSRINISEITFDGGSLNIIVYPDSITNIEKAVKKVVKYKKVMQEKSVEIDTLITKKTRVTDTSSELVLQIDNLELTDLILSAENHLTKNKILSKINRLLSEFTYDSSQVISSFNLDMKIDSLIKDNELILANKQVKLNSMLEINTDDIYVKLEDGRFSYGKAKFFFSGIFDSKNKGFLDLSVHGSEEGFSLFSIFLSDEAMKNLKSGDFSFEASVKGSTLIEFPQADIIFGLTNVKLINPVTRREIKNLNLRGQFHSGKVKDWSEAKIKIDTLYADLPDGMVSLSGSVFNFNIPEVDMSIFLSADVTGLDKVLKLNFIDDLRGKIEINDRFKGKYIVSEKRFGYEKNSSIIFFEDFGFSIPNVLKLDRVNGNISRENDYYYIDNLSIISDNTDLLLNGKVDNLQYLLFNIEKEINADLTIKSSILDLPNFLAFDPSIKRDFPYRILDIELDVDAKTTTSKALKFKSFPEIEFNIKRLNATVENLLPRMIIKSGKFEISENILGFNLNCKDFKTDFLGGQFNFSGVYNSSKAEPYYLKLDTRFRGISPSQLMQGEEDTIPEILSGKLSGSFFADLQFPEDSTLLKFLNLKDADLNYYSSSDTIEIKSLNLKVNDVFFYHGEDINPWGTLYVRGNFRSKEMRTNLFEIEDLNFNFSATNGTYKVQSEMVRLFGNNARGKSELLIKPFAEIPSFNISYAVSRFYAEELLATFLEDTVITGPLSLSMNLDARGDDWSSLVGDLNGQINLSGKDLLLYGLDADEIIEKFKRSQNFNLVDLGAVLLAGPVGIAVTKGSDIASIFVFNSGERTTINKLVSNWKIENGKFIIEDAAFTTSKNRVASNGFIDFGKDSLDLDIALIDKNACSVFSQRAYGKLNEPTLERVKVVKSILAPVTNLVDDILGIDCDVFYDGTVKHP